MPKTWYIETETEQRFGPYADITDAVADAERMDARIIAQDDDSGEVDTWTCPVCDTDAGFTADDIVEAGEPYCSDCDCDMYIVPKVREAAAPSRAVDALFKVRAAIRCNYDSAVIAREHGAEIDAALGGPDDRGPLENHDSVS